jgi:hypothetical protein
MAKMIVFISSVQKEFAEDRKKLADYLRSDALIGQFFEPFIFENLPADDQSPDHLYFDTVSRCEIYLGLFGADYGFENEKGISPTELEYNLASKENKFRLIFIKSDEPTKVNPKMQDLIRKASSQVTRKRFNSFAELQANVYSALVTFLVQRKYIAHAPFDARINTDTSLSDINDLKVATFVTNARIKRGFPLPEGSSTKDILVHLNLIQDGIPTNASILLFGNNPQKWVLSSVVKCAQFSW